MQAGRLAFVVTFHELADDLAALDDLALTTVGVIGS
jgi:hypothetical protein